MTKFSNILEYGYNTLRAAVCAVIVGFGFPHIGRSFKTFSEIFITLISISVLPIIFSSVTSGITRLLTEKLENVKITRIMYTFVLGLIIAAVIGVITCIVMNPGEQVANSETISNMIFQDMKNSISEISVVDPVSNLNRFQFSDFLTTLLPKNPFKAFAEGNVIQVMALSIMVGVAISKLEKERRKSAIKALSVIQDSFKAILSIPTKFLPIGIFFLLSSNLAKIDLNILLKMSYFCLCAVICFLIIICVALLLFALYSPIGLIDSIKALKQTVTVAFSTSNNQATLPFLMSDLVSKFKMKSEIVELSIPLGVTICRVSNAAYYAFVAVFVSSLYSVPFSFYHYIFIVFGAILTSLSASGASGIIAISMISIILDPLNLPIGSVLIVLVIVDPIIDPFRTTTSLIMNAALSCVVINKLKRKKSIKQ